MTDAGTALPPGFEYLEPVARRWRAECADERHRQRLSSTASEREALFQSLKDVVPAALAHLDATPLAEHGPADQRLMSLLLVFAHVAPAVEQQREFEAQHAIGAGRITITRAPSDPVR